MKAIRGAARIRAACLAAGLAVVVFASEARARVDPREKEWVATVVNRITDKVAKSITVADPRGAGARQRSKLRGLAMTVRVRIAADGTVAEVAIEEGTGSSDLDERTVQAVRSAGPFRPPPTQLLTLEGATDLSFPLELRSGAAN